MKEQKSNMFYGAAPILFELAKKLRQNQTEEEIYLYDILSGHRFHDFRFKRQHPILFFIADFYCHKLKFIIELDGNHHRLPEQYRYDNQRDDELKELGLTILRFNNKEIFSNIEQILKEIEKQIYQETK